MFCFVFCCVCFVRFVCFICFIRFVLFHLVFRAFVCFFVLFVPFDCSLFDCSLFYFFSFFLFRLFRLFCLFHLFHSFRFVWLFVSFVSFVSFVLFVSFVCSFVRLFPLFCFFSFVCFICFFACFCLLVCLFVFCCCLFVCSVTQPPHSAQERKQCKAYQKRKDARNEAKTHVNGPNIKGPLLTEGRPHSTSCGVGECRRLLHSSKEHSRSSGPVFGKGYDDLENGIPGLVLEGPTTKPPAHGRVLPGPQLSAHHLRVRDAF